jgi:hypothetical protein
MPAFCTHLWHVLLMLLSLQLQSKMKGVWLLMLMVLLQPLPAVTPALKMWQWAQQGVL